MGSYIFQAKTREKARGKQQASKETVAEPGNATIQEKGKSSSETSAKHCESDSRDADADTCEELEEGLRRVQTFSAQVEVEDALTPAHFAPRRRRDTCRA